MITTSDFETLEPFFVFVTYRKTFNETYSLIPGQISSTYPIRLYYTHIICDVTIFV